MLIPRSGGCELPPPCSGNTSLPWTTCPTVSLPTTKIVPMGHRFMSTQPTAGSDNNCDLVISITGYVIVVGSLCPGRPGFRSFHSPQTSNANSPGKTTTKNTKMIAPFHCIGVFSFHAASARNVILHQPAQVTDASADVSAANVSLNMIMADKRWE